MGRHLPARMTTIFALLALVCSGLACSDDDSVPTRHGDRETTQEKTAPVVAKPLQFQSPALLPADTHRIPELLPGRVTFAKNIAPIIFNNCTSCHRPGESAPFSLLNYRQIKARARQIAEVTLSRFMPPWAPTHGYVEFAGVRRLPAQAIAQLQRWYRDDCPLGDKSLIPKIPKRTSGWTEGTPDLVLEMDREFIVRAEGRDVFQSFVFSVDIASDKYVRAIEIRPENLVVAHHAIVSVDETPSCREEDLKSPEAGYPGMDFHNAAPPPGYFIGWTPGKRPTLSLPGMAWKLRRGSDIVLQMHLVTTGKSEKFKAKIGLYFTDEVPTRQAYSLELRNDNIDVAAEASGFEVEDSIVLPVVMSCLGIYPHAHYIGKKFSVFAIKPNGDKVWLFYAGDWDFNWQDSYTFADPIVLPKNTRVVMQIEYDNRSENLRNPNSPAKRIRYGLQSTDEMGTCTVTLLPRNKDGLAAMGIAVALKDVDDHSQSWLAYSRLGRTYAFARKMPKAIATFKKGLTLAKHPELQKNLGNALAMTGSESEAIPYFRAALRGYPDDASLNFSLALALSNTKQKPAALPYLRAAIASNRNMTNAYLLLGQNLTQLGRKTDAIEVYQDGASARPDRIEIHSGLAKAYAAAGHPEASIQVLQRATVWARKNRQMQLLGQLSALLRTYQR